FGCDLSQPGYVLERQRGAKPPRTKALTGQRTPKWRGYAPNSRMTRMTPTNSRQSSVVEKFHELHAAGCFVLPNPWDAGSAVYLEQLGFKALASTSAGFAFSRGLPDSPRDVSRDL